MGVNTNLEKSFNEHFVFFVCLFDNSYIQRDITFLIFGLVYK